MGKIYTVGFRTAGAEMVGGVEGVGGLFVVVCALGAEKSHLVGPLLRHFGGEANGARGSDARGSDVRGSDVRGSDVRSDVRNQNGNGRGRGKVFLDLASGPRRTDPLAVAESYGWMAYGVADTSAFTTVEMLRLLVGQNVPYSFVRLASGRGLY